MKVFIRIASLLVLCWGEIVHANLLHDDQFSFEVNLMSSSGNSISASGEVFPGQEIFCLPPQAVGCDGVWYDGVAANRGPTDSDFFVFFDVLEGGVFNGIEVDNVISMVFFDATGTTGDTAWGTVTYSGLGWGDQVGAILGAGSCTSNESTCPPELFSQTIVLSESSVMVTISEQMPLDLLPNNDAAPFAFVNTAIVAEHVPVPSTVLLLGLGIAALRLSRRAH